MNRSATFVLIALLAVATAAQAEIRGGWTASISDKPGKIHFNLTREHSNNGQTMQFTDFSGLTEGQVNAATQTPLTFEMRREAGTVTFEGVFKKGAGGGQFSFAPNTGYLATLRSMGLSLEEKSEKSSKRRSHRHEDSEEVQLFNLALHDVSTSFIKAMRSLGYNEDLDQYVAMRIFRVTPELVQDFRSLDFQLTAEQLVSAQIHKMTPAYVREMRASGFRKMDFDDLVSSRIHKATPEFVAKMTELGYGNLKWDNYIAFRIHRVTPEFVQELATLGYRNIPADDLLAMRIHRVTPEFIREMEAAGYRNVPVDKLVSMRIHGIDAKFVQRMNKSQ